RCLRFVALFHFSAPCPTQFSPLSLHDALPILTGVPVSAEEAYWAPPLVTARELVTTIVSNLLRTPGNLGHALFAEQPNVPYAQEDRKSTRLNSSHEWISYAVFCLKKKKQN